jgi:CBS domain-containing protein
MPPLPSVLQAKRFGVFQCRPDMPLLEAARRMVAEDVSALVVTNAAGHMCGLLSRTDVLRAHLAGADWMKQPVSQVMSTEVVTVEPDDTLEVVASRLVEHHIHRVVVVRREDSGLRPLSVVSDSDLVYHLVRSAD